MVEENKKNIYEGGTDAFSYAIILLITLVVPTIISLVTDEALYLMVSMFTNSLGLIKENLLLLKHKKVFKRFWFERAIGTFFSVIIALYNIIALCCWVAGIGQEIITSLNFGFAMLFFVPVLISGLEGILFAVKDFKDNSLNENSVDLVIAQSTTVDV